MDTETKTLTVETAATLAPEATATSETSSTPTDDAAHAGRRKRIEELKKSLTSGSNTALSPAVSTTDETVVTNETASAAVPNGSTPATPEQPTTAASETATAVGTLPADYLRDGYYQGEGKNRYPDPALVDHAEALGQILAAGGVTPTAFNRMVKVLKSAAKLPLPGQQGALKKLLPLALKEKKAPPLLREVVERNRAAVETEADFAACLDHFQDIGIFLAAAQTK